MNGYSSAVQSQRYRTPPPQAFQSQRRLAATPAAHQQAVSPCNFLIPNCGQATDSIRVALPRNQNATPKSATDCTTASRSNSWAALLLSPGTAYTSAVSDGSWALRRSVQSWKSNMKSEQSLAAGEACLRIVVTPWNGSPTIMVGPSIGELSVQPTAGPLGVADATDQRRCGQTRW